MNPKEPDLILDVIPDYARGRRAGFSDEETEDAARRQFNEMRVALERQTNENNEASKPKSV